MSATVSSHQTVRLSPGRHESPADGVCVMELASMLAGERFTDHPRSVDPVLAAFLREYNDRTDDRRRQDLYALASTVVGTRTRFGFRRRCHGAMRDGVRQQTHHRVIAARDAAVELAAACARDGDAGHRRAISLVSRLADEAGAPAPDLARTAPVAHRT